MHAYPFHELQTQGKCARFWSVDAQHKRAQASARAFGFSMHTRAQTSARARFFYMTWACACAYVPNAIACVLEYLPQKAHAAMGGSSILEGR